MCAASLGSTLAAVAAPVKVLLDNNSCAVARICCSPIGCQPAQLFSPWAVCHAIKCGLVLGTCSSKAAAHASIPRHTLQPACLPPRQCHKPSCLLSCCSLCIWCWPASFRPARPPAVSIPNDTSYSPHCTPTHMHTPTTPTDGATSLYAVTHTHSCTPTESKPKCRTH